MRYLTSVGQADDADAVWGTPLRHADWSKYPASCMYYEHVQGLKRQQTSHSTPAVQAPTLGKRVLAITQLSGDLLPSSHLPGVFVYGLLLLTSHQQQEAIENQNWHVEARDLRDL